MEWRSGLKAVEGFALATWCLEQNEMYALL